LGGRRRVAGDEKAEKAEKAGEVAAERRAC